MKEKIKVFRVIRKTGKAGRSTPPKIKGFKNPIWVSFDWLYWVETFAEQALWRSQEDYPELWEKVQGKSNKEQYLIAEKEVILDIEEYLLDKEEIVSFCHSGYHFEWYEETQQSFLMTAEQAKTKYLMLGENPDHEIIIDRRV